MTSIAINNNLMQAVSSTVNAVKANSKEANNVWQGVLLGLLVGFAPMAASFAVAHLMGLNPFLYGDLRQQAITTGMAITPFTIYCVLLSAKRSTKAFAVTSAIVTGVFGVILAAVV